MARRVTPTGVLLMKAGTPREVWLAERRNGIGASDLPKIVDKESKYGDALTVWAEKSGLLPDEPMGEAAQWGIDFEGPIADAWARKNQVRVTRVGMLAHAGHGWRRATLDRLVHGCERGPCALQVKTRTGWMEEEWKDDKTPDRVYAQMQWEMHVSGFDHEHLAVLIGGNKPIQRTIEEDLAVQAYLVDEATRVWECVQVGSPPQVDPIPGHIDFYRVLYPVREGDVELPPEAAQYLATYRSQGDLGGVHEEAQQTAKAALIGLLGAGERGLLDGRPVFTYKRPRATARCDLDALAKDWPDAYAATVKTSDSSPRFHLVKDTS